MKNPLLLIPFFSRQTVPPLAATSHHPVRVRSNFASTNWRTFTAKTVDKLPGSSFTTAPALGVFSGGEVYESTATGLYWVEKKRIVGES